MTEEIFYPEQQRVLAKIEKARGGIVFWKVGTGKTRIGLQSFATLQKVYKWPNPCVVLVVCKPKCFYDWRRELSLVGFDWVVLENDMAAPYEVLDQMQLKPTMLLVSHAMLAKRAAYLEKSSIRMVIIDDGYMFKNPKAAKTKAAHKLTLSRRAVLLSGSVMTQRNLEDVYGQAFAVNQHRRIAPNLTRFRSDYLNCKIDPDRKYPVYTPKKGSYDAIVKALGDAADFYFPPNAERKIHHQVIRISATTEQRCLWRDLRMWYEARNYNLELDNALQVTLQIQRISNGWILDDNGCRHNISNNKIERTVELVETIIAAGEQCVIWCAFTVDIDVLSVAMPFATMQMSSRHPFDPNAWKAREASVCIATEASGVGINHFEQTPYAIYFSMDWKWLDLQQSRGRTDRRSSKHTECFYYYLQTEGSLDRRIYDVATGSGDRELTLVKHGEISAWLKQK